MTRSLFLSALMAGVIAAAVPAQAADDIPPEFRSSSFDIYLGTFGAANLLKSTYREADTDDALTGSLDGYNGAIGIRGGVDYVMDNWVIGAVADWSFAFGESMASNSLDGAELNMPNLATIRARAGYSSGTTLFYVTGGYAQAEMEMDIQGSADFESLGTANDWTAGWTLGAGVDIALTQQVTMGIEYLYVNLADPSYDFDTGGDPVTYEQDLDPIHSIRLGVNYAFSI